MAVQLTSEQERQLVQLAARGGRTPDELAQEAVARFLTYQAHFVADVEEGRAAAERGELHDHEDVMAMIDGIVERG